MLVFSLAGLFALFNVGIPVIVASCPMAPAGGQAGCNACVVSIADDLDSLLPRTDTSCCETIFAAAPAGVSFLKNSVAPIETESILVPLTTLSNSDPLNQHHTTRTVSGHLQTGRSPDLPVLFSSLLI